MLYSFRGATDGAGPSGGLLRDKAGNLYGTTSGGGSSSCYEGCGTVFELSPSAKGGFWTEPSCMHLRVMPTATLPHLEAA